MPSHLTLHVTGFRQRYFFPLRNEWSMLDNGCLTKPEKVTIEREELHRPEAVCRRRNEENEKDMHAMAKRRTDASEPKDRGKWSFGRRTACLAKRSAPRSVRDREREDQDEDGRV